MTKRVYTEGEKKLLQVAKENPILLEGEEVDMEGVRIFAKYLDWDCLKEGCGKEPSFFESVGRDEYNIIVAPTFQSAIDIAGSGEFVSPISRESAKHAFELAIDEQGVFWSSDKIQQELEDTTPRKVSLNCFLVGTD